MLTTRTLKPLLLLISEIILYSLLLPLLVSIFWPLLVSLLFGFLLLCPSSSGSWPKLFNFYAQHTHPGRSLPFSYHLSMLRTSQPLSSPDVFPSSRSLFPSASEHLCLNALKFSLPQSELMFLLHSDPLTTTTIYESLILFPLSFSNIPLYIP